jgi:ABC-2 type transport system permease protein
MIGLVVRLRWRLWSRLVQRNVGLLVSTILGILVGLGLTVLGAAALVVVGLAAPQLRGAVVVALAMLTLSWTVLSVLAAAADTTVDPARFAVLPVRPRPLAIGLFAAVLTGIPPVLLTVVALSTVVTWGDRLSSAAAALGSAVLGVLLTVLLARVVVGLLAGVMSSRRGRAVGAALISLVALTPAALGIALGSGLPATTLDTTDLDAAARLVGRTPVGWPWAIPMHVSAGDHAAAALTTLATVVGIAALWAVYERQVGRALTSPLRSVGDQRIRGRGLILRWAPLGPLGVIAARRLVMWRRDTRLVTVAVQSLVLPVLLVAQSLLTGEAWSARIALIALAVLSGLTLLNDLAYDGTSWALHVMTGVRGWQDRLGRVIGTALLYVPLLVILYAVLTGLGLLPQGTRWPALVVVALGAGLGTACLVGALMPGVAPKPGGNPFASTTGSGTQGLVGGLIAFVTPIACLVPVAVAGLLVPDTPVAQAGLLAFALAWAATLLGGGVVLGGLRLDARAPEMLDRLRRAEL